jgi:hypothetical protein
LCFYLKWIGWKLDRDDKKALVKEIADKVISWRYPEKKDSNIVGVDNEWGYYLVLIVGYGLVFAGGFVAIITGYNKYNRELRYRG